jgi:CheY-like chemotaxis protein
MNVLIIDKSDVAAQLVKTKLEKLGHTVVNEPSKEKALALVEKTNYDFILLDPAPLPDAKSIILSLRRAGAAYAYIGLLSGDDSQAKAISAGANDILVKPVNQERLNLCIEHADHVTGLIRRIGNTTKDFPSAGGIIAKSAFYQLFISAFERGGRYGERTHIMFVSLENYHNITKESGSYAGNLIVAHFSKALASIRRQSDIVGQTSPFEYAVLLQRAQKDDEPKQAAGRFADTLKKMLQYDAALSTVPRMRVKLIEVPTGQKICDYRWEMNATQNSAA